MRLFGKAQSAPQYNPGSSLERLRGLSNPVVLSYSPEALHSIEKREEFVEQRISQELATAKANAVKNKKSKFGVINSLTFSRFIGSEAKENVRNSASKS